MADRNFTRTTTVRTCDLALCVTIICDEQKPPPPPRRHLAPNVACMFAADRPVVINERRRGRLPRGVARFSIPPFFAGEVVEIFYPGDNPNNGKRVKVLGYVPSEKEFDVESVNGMLHTFDEHHNPVGQHKTATAPGRNLRRIARYSR